MRHQALISFEFDAIDIYEEAAQKQRIETALANLRSEFPGLGLQIKRRRRSSPRRCGTPPPLDGSFQIVQVRYVP